MRRRTKDPGSDPDRRPPYLLRYRAEDWVDAPAPPDPGYAADCTVCAYWWAQGQWSADHPDAPIDFDFDMPDDPWHPELI